MRFLFELFCVQLYIVEDVKLNFDDVALSQHSSLFLLSYKCHSYL